MSHNELDEFFSQATDRLNAATLPSKESDVLITPDEIRKLILQTQKETAGYENLQESLSSTTLASSAADRLNQTARETYARLILEATCRNILSVKPRQTDDTVLQEFFALCQASTKIGAVRDHLRYGTPLFGIRENDDAVIGKFPQQRLVQIQKRFLKSLGVDVEEATELIRQRFMDITTRNNGDDDPLFGSFTAMAKDLRDTLQSVTQSIMMDDTDDGTTRIVSVQHSEKLIDAQTGQEISVVPQSENNNIPTTEQIHHESCPLTDKKNNESSSLLAQASQLQKTIRDELSAMSEIERNVLLARADQVTNQVLQDAMAIQNLSDRIFYLSSLDSDTQRLMAIQKIWQGMSSQQNNVAGRVPRVQQHIKADH